MNLDRLKAPALAAVAVLIISGAGIATAHTGPASPGATNAPPVTVNSAAPAASTGTVGLSAPEASQAPGSVATAEPTDGPETPAASEPPQTNSDGTGGHADPAGQNVDHQFDGQE
jgi:hypothetical protein